MKQNVQTSHFNHQQPAAQWFPLPTRAILVGLIIVLALLSRFLFLGNRVMSHDEVNHVVPSYALYQGKGYVHDPITHGPFQFHIIALMYFLFGDSDTTSRIPAALFSVTAVIFVLFAFPRYLGRNGALIAGALFTLSPFMLFYGRYTRNEGLIELIGVLLLYGILRYLETGDRLGIFLVTLATAMHFIIKETAFIYTAQAMLFLLILFLFEVRRGMKEYPATYHRFLSFMAMALLFIFLTLGAGISQANQAKTTDTIDQTTITESQTTTSPSIHPLIDSANWLLVLELGSLLAAGVMGLLGLRTVAKATGWQAVKQIRSFSLLLLLGTLILPLLSPLPVSLLGWNPLDYSSTLSILRTGVFVFLFFLIACTIGLWWNPILWLQNGLLFYAIFTVFYTTFFTNANGFLTGIVGSLGYWLSQQTEERGSQPLYYYVLIQMPIYEYLASFGTLLAAYFGFHYRRLSTLPGTALAFTPRMDLVSDSMPSFETESELMGEPETTDGNPESRNAISTFSASLYQQPHPVPVLGLLLFWAGSSLIAYSLAGERMPWLTVHITLPCLLAAGWGLGYLVDTTDWQQIRKKNGYLSLLLLPVFGSSLTGVLMALLGATPPFHGNSLDQLQATNHFLLSLITTSLSLMGLIYLLRGWQPNQVLRLTLSVFIFILAVLTARTAYRVAFIRFDDATEYLVYAHAAPAPKEVLQEVEMISRQTVGDKAIQIAYGGEALYPYWWYLRDFPNSQYFGNTPARDLRNDTVIIAGEDLFEQMKPIVGDEYLQFEYVRLWWPNENYRDLTWDRLWGAIANPQMRAAILQIWLNRNYRDYATLTNQTAQFAPETWQPARRMRVYIRKDVAAQIWSFGAALALPIAEKVDPYVKGMVNLQPIQVIGSMGSQPGQFQAPRGIKVAPDGSFYIADSRNHRIQHLAFDGSLLGVWGVFADVSLGEAPGGTFNEPWDVAIGEDGSVYVADTWNHRIQKFTPDGRFIQMWGYFGQGEAPDVLWGPRGLAVDGQGRLFVVDTGNKRVVVFDADGNFITQLGSAGSQPGQMDEPVGIAIDSQGDIFVADTWNLRVQVFSPIHPGGNSFQFTRAWEIAGWDGQSLENKPFLTINPVDGDVLVTDPEAARVLEFDKDGAFLRGWEKRSGDSSDPIGILSGIAVDQQGGIWVTDSFSQKLFRFQ